MARKVKEKGNYINNFINGDLVEPFSKDYLDNYNPANGTVYSYIPDSDENDVKLAVDASLEAFDQWAKTSPSTRSKILLRIADMIEQNLVTFAMAESIDSGKPLSIAKSIDIPNAANSLRFFANGIMHFDSKSHMMESMGINYTIRQPIGVAGCISSWNHPLYLFVRKIAPALAAGNTVVAKPSSKTPMTVFMFSEVCIEAGLPPGVLNIVHGHGSKVGKAIVSHKKINTISFTGKTKTGKLIAKATAATFKKVSLEMGGKNCAIIFEDCDYDEMLRTTIRSSFSNQGQNCHCSSRIFIERPIYEKFKRGIHQ